MWYNDDNHETGLWVYPKNNEDNLYDGEGSHTEEELQQSAERRASVEVNVIESSGALAHVVGAEQGHAAVGIEETALRGPAIVPEDPFGRRR